MIVPVRALSDITLARWVESGIGNSFKLETALDSGSSGSITDFTGLQPSFFGQGLVLPILMAALLTAVTLIFTAIVLDRRVINAIYDEYDLLDEGPGGGQAVRPVASPA